jgi:hypothetical protein
MTSGNSFGLPGGHVTEIRDGGNLDAEWPALLLLIGGVVAANTGRHPGIIADAIVDRIAATYVLTPREQHHREQRKNHLERTRRFSYEVYRILADRQDIDPGREIAARMLKSFLLARRVPAASLPAAGS